MIALSAMAVTHAQFPEPDPQREAARKQLQEQIQQLVTQRAEEQRQAANSCFTPNLPNQPIGTVATFDGQRYRCEQVFLSSPFDTTMRVRMAGWIKN